MRIEGSRLVVTCRTCGLSVVAVGWDEGQEASVETAPDPPGRAMAGGRLELEEGDESPRGGGSEARVEPTPREQPVDEARPAVRPTPSPKTRPTPSRAPQRIAMASAAVAVACAIAFFAWPKGRKGTALEPRVAEPSATAVPAAEPSTKPTAPALLPASPAPAPTPEPRRQASATARPALQSPTPKPAALAPVPSAMPEAELLSSGLVDAEVFQDRAGKIMTHVLFCRNLEQARNPGTSFGAFDVSLIVSPSGAVSDVRLDGAVARSPLGQCLRDHLGKLQFPGWTGRAAEIRRHVDR
jgi:hypothetical protein